MKLSCLQENLNRGLAIVGRAVATRTTLPITQNVLLVTDQSRLKLTATNLEIAVSTWIGSQVEEEGSITIPARLLTEFVSSLPGDKIDIEQTDKPLGLQIRCARFDANIHGIDADEFPPIPSVDNGVSANIDPTALKNAISQVVFAAATDDSRPVLTGIKVEIEGSNFTLAAADGFRLAVHKGNLQENISEDLNFIVPAKTLAEIGRLIGDQDEAIEVIISAAKSQVLFKLRNIEVVSQLVQGTFPNYSQLIPQTYGTRAIVGLQEFLRASKAASIFARDGSGIIKLHMSPGQDGGRGTIQVSSKAEEVGDHFGEIDANVEGEASSIAFNSKYLMDVLSVVGVGEIALETTTASSPGVIKLADSDSYIHVVMPMFVQW
jgi:DNA polymerase-3 subunit beta